MPRCRHRDGTRTVTINGRPWLFCLACGVNCAGPLPSEEEVLASVAGRWGGDHAAWALVSSGRGCHGPYASAMDAARGALALCAGDLDLLQRAVDRGWVDVVPLLPPGSEGGSPDPEDLAFRDSYEGVVHD